MDTLISTNEWKALLTHYQKIHQTHLHDFFAVDPDRFGKFSLQYKEILFDFSKNHLTEETLSLLVNLAKKCELDKKINLLLAGEIINSSENLPAAHTALRSKTDVDCIIDNKNVIEDIQILKNKMASFCRQIQSGEWHGFTGERITDVVSIGIGGAELGAAMVVDALASYRNHHVKTHFISNIDGTHIHETLKHLHPKSTLFIINSKSFATHETLVNAHTAKKWLQNSFPSHLAFKRHFVAVTSNYELALQFGFEIEQIFPIWNWVGGRYSLWSATGLPIALSIGMENFATLLAGAQAVDDHFKTAPFRENIPVMMALISIWYNNFFDASSHAIVPYDQNLKKLPSYLQQLGMESNGKRVTHEGKLVNYATAPIIWGDIGANSQHSFHQLLHQGTRLIPVDFIIACNSHHPLTSHHHHLLANCFAQSKALMFGKTRENAYNELIKQGLSDKEASLLAKHKETPGNKPSNTIVLPKFTPFYLGALLALYEHKTFVESVIWDINSFDQWGVELGKQLFHEILPDLQNNEHTIKHDSSTNGLINTVKRFTITD